MYGVTWSANGEVLYVDSIAEEVKISVLPSDPTSCSTESNVFMGWAVTLIDGTQEGAPSPLYTKASDFPAVTQDVTYYAVFAKEETGSSASATYTRYITSCQGTMEVDPVMEDKAATRKILVGGQLYIIHNNQLFTIQGQRVK